MRALVIGASGQIGGHLLAQLAERGHAAVGTRRSHGASPLPVLDIADETALGAAIVDVAPDAVFLPAGWTWVDGCEKDPARSRLENFERPLAVARLAARVGATFVGYSTDYVFDGARGPYREGDAVGPLNVYGRDKLDLELALAKEGLPHLVIRTTTVYGPEVQGKNFVYQVVAKARAKERMKVPADQFATPAYGPDVAAATIELLEQRARGVFHAAGPDFLDRATFGRLACAVLGLDPETIESVTTDSLGQPARRPLRGGLICERLPLPVRGARAGLEALQGFLSAGAKG